MEDLQKLCGTIENVVYANADTNYTVIEVDTGDELITAAGEIGDVSEGEDITLHGQFVTHQSYGRQFKISCCEVALPKSEAAVRKYLSGGALPHIGPALAARIVDCFGTETLDVIASQPERLSKIKGLSAQKAKNISYEFNKVFGIREAIAWLSRFGIGTSKAVDAFKLYGPNTISILSNDPYLLCFGGLDISFKTVDAIAFELQLDGENDRRISAAVIYILRHNLQNGHTCLPKASLVEKSAGFIGVEAQLVEGCILRMIDNKDIVIEDFGDKEFVFLRDMYCAEKNIAQHLAFLLKLPQSADLDAQSRIDFNESLTGVKYSALQREAITAAISQRVLVLTGGPGTGKTTAVNAMLSCLEAQHERVELAAPTGRAAKRLSELTGRKAQTIHRLLEVDFSKDTAVRFIHNEKNKLRCDAIIIDEMSMVDAQLFESLLAALKSNCRVIMVGDEDQLPSVGAGSVLAGVIASDRIPCVRLKEVFRQAAQSLIVSNAHNIVKGEMPQKGTKNDDFFIMESAGDAAAELVGELVSKRLPAAYGYDVTDIQVLCPSKIGAAGTVALNVQLQQLLNPPMANKKQLSAFGRIYRQGDKIMQIKNNYEITFMRDNGEEGIGAFNGDMGIIEEVDVQTGTIVVRSEDKRYVYSLDNLNQLEPAYAVTIHKSQGSEFSAVVIPVTDVPQKLCYRNLLYTGVTRAKSLCILVGQNKIINTMVNNARQNKRFTCINNFLRQEISL